MTVCSNLKPIYFVETPIKMICMIPEIAVLVLEIEYYYLLYLKINISEFRLILLDLITYDNTFNSWHNGNAEFGSYYYTGPIPGVQKEVQNECTSCNLQSVHVKIMHVIFQLFWTTLYECNTLYQYGCPCKKMKWTNLSLSHYQCVKYTHRQNE